jgi:hypothetical protein
MVSTVEAAKSASRLRVGGGVSELSSARTGQPGPGWSTRKAP